MKVLITGASGYIGQHLCRVLADAGWEVRGMSRSSQPPSQFRGEWARGDVTDGEAVIRAVSGCQKIVHLACLPLRASTQDPAAAFHINACGTVQVLEAARHAGVEKVVFTSTGQVYGGQAPLPNRETQPPQPDSPYAASKLCAEIWCETYARTYGLPVQILRLFNVYGLAADGTHRSTVETIFLLRIAQGKSPQVQGHPQSGRDFIHVGDIVRAILSALRAPVCSGAINIGSGTLTTLRELALAAARALGRDLQPEMVETDEPPVRFQADTRRAREMLGFQAHVTLEAGLLGLARAI